LSEQEDAKNTENRAGTTYDLVGSVLPTLANGEKAISRKEREIGTGKAGISDSRRT
jgi:hypothetical protein